MLQLTSNLFRGGGDEARVRELVDQLNIAAEIRHKTHVAITEAVSHAWIEIGAAQSRLELLEAHYKSTEKVLDAYRAQYEVERRTLLDTLNAESEMYQAKTDLVNGRYDLLAAQHRLLGEMGALVKSFGLAGEDVLEHTANN
jgi:adhesin transport system outer membrane protein